MIWERLLINSTLIDAHGVEHRRQAIAIQDTRIAWCGSMDDLPANYLEHTAVVEDCLDHLITPGLINCHSHLVYAGNRAHEFQQRLQGATYAEIARTGGGILSTVEATRNASEEELLTQSLPRIEAMRTEGVTTVEIKSGYGLDLQHEIKMLRVAKQLEKLSGVRVKTTFLGAHAVPPEYKNKPQKYIDFLCHELLPLAAEEQLVDAVDIFCESIAFSIKQAEQLFIQAQRLGLPIKCHAEQLSNIGATQLAASYGALSCDHLEYLNREGASLMAKQGTVAVLLPGAYYFLKEKKKPPVALLREMGVAMAVATDTNPGSSPTTSLLLMLNMACQFFDFSVPEALMGVTTNAAKALGISDTVGLIAPGFIADLARWTLTESTSLCYYFGYSLPCQIMVSGQWLT